MSKRKFTKLQLKSLVKECLLEILYESAGSQSPIAEASGHTSTRAVKKPDTFQRRVGLDNVSLGAPKVENINFLKNIDSVTSEMTSDPVLSEILADTAKTTLQEQIERHGSGGGAMPVATAGDYAARVVDSSSPDELFGEASGKWAQLAFANTVKRG